MTKYKILDRQTGELIESDLTLEQAKQIIEVFEETDKSEGIYEPDFYEIVEITETI
jgi:hypothetical protein